MEINWSKLTGLNILNLAITLHFDIDKTLLTSILVGIAIALISFERVREQ